MRLKYRPFIADVNTSTVWKSMGHECLRKFASWPLNFSDSYHSLFHLKSLLQTRVTHFIITMYRSSRHAIPRWRLRLGIFGNFAPGYSRLISGGILESWKLPLLRKSYTHCMISNYQHTSVKQIVIARNRKPLCSDLPFKMRWFRPSNPIKCAVIDCQNYRLSE